MNESNWYDALRFPFIRFIRLIDFIVGARKLVVFLC